MAIRRHCKPSQRGFTLLEVLVSLIVFAIAVVGLVAIESRSIESQKASAQIRDAERLAQDEMSQLRSAGFLQLIYEDFEGNDNPEFPYNDDAVDAATRLRDFRRPPSELEDDVVVAGSISGQYIVHRTVDWVFDVSDPPSNPPVLGNDETRINALVLDVTVMWIDDTNPAFPPPADAVVTALTPDMIVPDSGAFEPYVGHVQLRTVRVNDTALAPGEIPAP